MTTAQTVKRPVLKRTLVENYPPASLLRPKSRVLVPLTGLEKSQSLPRLVIESLPTERSFEQKLDKT